jgi:pSer/pThr/pTyr-binding forkhead associated (FHA) protein
MAQAPRPVRTAGVPVVGVGPSAPKPGELRVCDRCHGSSDAGAPFCKFCGAPLNNNGRGGPAVAVAAAPSPAPIADGHAPGATPMIPPPPDTSKYQSQAPGPAPVEPSYGRIVVITKDGGEGPSYPLLAQLDIGRSEGQVVIAEDRYLSPRHARIARRVSAGGEADFFLRDLASTNGVFMRLGNALRGDGRVEVPLQDQDLFLVGQQVLRFEVVKDAEDGLGPATQHGTLLFGTPTAPRLARLCQRTVEGVTRDVFHVRKTETVIGRESGDIVFTDDPFLSRRHALVKVDRDKRQYSLADLGSSNGTFVQVRGEVSIKSGDQFRIGQQLFRIELGA